MQKAQGYTPTIIYAKAGGDIAKHALVQLSDQAIVHTVAKPNSQSAVGIALTQAKAGEFLPVQTDGIIYEWEGSPTDLIPGQRYFQGSDGAIAALTSLDNPWPVGFAVARKVFHLRIGAGSGASSEDSSNYSTIHEHLWVPSQFNQQVFELMLPTPVPSADFIEDLILYGGDIHLKPKIDFVYKKSENSDSIDKIVWNRDELDPGQISILERLRTGDLITVVRRRVSSDPIGPEGEEWILNGESLTSPSNLQAVPGVTADGGHISKVPGEEYSGHLVDGGNIAP